jgi:hypothetical protein
MNTALLRKLLGKHTLRSLFDEVKDNDAALCELGSALQTKHAKLFASLMRSAVEGLIAAPASVEKDDAAAVIKMEIIFLDGTTSKVSLNKSLKAKASKTNPVVVNTGSCNAGTISPRC